MSGESGRAVARRFVLDRAVRRFPGIVLGGSPPSLFRITPTADRIVDRIEAGEPIAGSRLVTALLDGGAIHPRLDSDTPSRFSVGDVTIVVPTLGRPVCVASGASRTIVVDDGSAPPVERATLRLAINRGPGAARNAGFELVTTPFVAFVDADVEVPAGWLEGLLPHLADERVALVAPRVRARHVADSVLARYERRRAPLDLGPDPGRVRAGNQIGYVPAAAIVCRTDALREIGGFDETLRFGEDVDLVWRLDRAGWRCRYEPAVVVHHEPRRTWRAWLAQRFAYGSSAAPLALRHPGAVAPLRTNAWSLAAWIAPLAGRSVAATLAATAGGAAIAIGSSVALIPKLAGVPARESVRFALCGHLAAGRQLAQSIRRVYWPLLVLLAIGVRPARRALLLAALAARAPVAIADDVAYSVGLWRGVVAHRTTGPLRPTISAWPPRRGRRARSDRLPAAR